MRPANERQRYNVTSSLIGWALSQNDSWTCQNRDPSRPMPPNPIRACYGIFLKLTHWSLWCHIGYLEVGQQLVMAVLWHQWSFLWRISFQEWGFPLWKIRRLWYHFIFIVGILIYTAFLSGFQFQITASLSAQSRQLWGGPVTFWKILFNFTLLFEVQGRRTVNFLTEFWTLCLYWNSPQLIFGVHSARNPYYWSAVLVPDLPSPLSRVNNPLFEHLDPMWHADPCCLSF